ncbi:hypothetical protein D7S89_11245 [Trinickia fusca]|uniref:Uncharacterized protein n=1 Tax=Trinickia fusca TaxID=2419777 RepID=A0A494XEW1_9BURK|nr:hypothetical protein D7S89_11245 [Trinickia fusca]
MILFVALLLTSYMQAKTNLVLAQDSSQTAHTGLALIGALAALVKSCVIIDVFLFVVRHTLLGATATQGFAFVDKAFWRYVGASLLIVLGILAAVVVLSLVVVFALGSRPTWWWPMALIALVAWLVGVRASLVFTHIAIGNTIQWRAAWQDSRGHFWSITLTYLIAMLPLIAVALVFVAGYELALRDMIGAAYQAQLIALGAAVWMYATCSLHAACSAWLYRRYAVQLLETA